MYWSHYNPVRIDAEEGGLARLQKHVDSTGEVLLVTTEGFVHRGQAEEIAVLLGRQRVHIHAGVTPNPELDHLDETKRQYALLHPNAIVALGGGSVLDSAKALSVILGETDGAPLARVFRDGQAQAWTRAIPVIAIPTTSGTGSEVTPFATVWDGTQHRKHSLTGDLLFPTVALLEPSLTLSLPETETLHTALDAVSHALESLWNKNRTPMSEAFATQALRLAIDALPRVLEAPTDLAARAQMQQASTLAGLAISQTRTAIAHAISYPLTSRFGVPHGLACSFSLPRIIEAYLGGHEERHRSLLLEVGETLEPLGLPARLARYASRNQIAELREEMFLPGRADNFIGTADLDTFLAE